MSCVLEMHITAHPIALLRAGADRYGCIPVREAIFRMPGEKIRVIALIAAMRRVPTSRGILQFLTIEDETGLLEGHVIQSVYRRIGEQVKTPGPYLIEGQMMRDQEASFVQISSMNAFHWRHHRPFNAGAAPQ